MDNCAYVFKNDILPLISNYIMNFKTSKTIILMGEKSIETNIETTTHGVISLYDILIKMSDNNNLIDLTKETLCSGNDNFDNFLEDIEIINKADLNICFGIGGPYLITHSFSKNVLHFTLPTNHAYIDYVSRTHTFHNIDKFLEKLSLQQKQNFKYYGQFSPPVDGQFGPPVDKFIHENYFKNKFGGVSIECGAFDGLLECSTKFFEDTYDWKTINIEPLPNVFDKLIKNRPNSININLALSNNDDDKIFTNYKHPTLGYDWGNGSLNHTEEHKRHLEDVCGHNNYITHVVKTNTYKQVIDKLGIKQLDLFVLDVEGHELDVIDGMVGCDVLPDVFVIEHGHSSPEIFIEKFKSINFPYKLDNILYVNSFFIKI
jgi:FkbM family methyltransferase